MSVFTGAAALAAALAAAGGTAAAGIYGANKSSGAAQDAAKLQTDAANHAADLQSKSTADALAFQKQEAENQWQNSQATQRANYEQSKARYGSIASVASQYGLNLGAMPDYAPGIDPHYDTGGSPLPSTSTTPNAAGTIAGAAGTSPAPGTIAGAAPPAGNFSDPAYAAKFVQYYAGQPGANPSLQRDPNYWIGKITSGELGTDPKYIVSKFMTPEGAPAGSIAAASKMGVPSAAAPLSGIAPTTPIPTPYQPGTIGAYGRRF